MQVDGEKITPEKEAELAERAAKLCQIFPDGVHCFYIVQNQSPLFIKLAKYCPCGAMVVTKRYEIEAFMEGLIPRLVEVDELGVPIKPTEPS